MSANVIVLFRLVEMKGMHFGTLADITLWDISGHWGTLMNIGFGNWEISGHWQT